VERAYLKPRNYTINKGRNPNFAELEAKNKSHIPGPNYNTTYDWGKMNKDGKGKFLKS
jgi:hypothetical protein